MAHSSLLGIDRTQPPAPGHDNDALGPSDSSDSGSDVASLSAPDDGGPGAPLDKATDTDIERPDTSNETIGPGIDSDSAGSGERRSAGSDFGSRDGADIAPDRIVADPDASNALDDPASIDAIDAAANGDDDPANGDEDEEDEDADPVGEPPANDEGDDTVLVPR